MGWQLATLYFTPETGFSVYPSAAQHTAGADAFDIDPEDFQSADAFHCRSCSNGWIAFEMNSKEWREWVADILMSINLPGEYSVDQFIYVSRLKMTVLDGLPVDSMTKSMRELLNS